MSTPKISVRDALFLMRKPYVPTKMKIRLWANVYVRPTVKILFMKEKPQYLRESMLSMWNQTVKTDDFILVCDGPLTKELDDVIDDMKNIYGDVLHIY